MPCEGCGGSMEDVMEELGVPNPDKPPAWHWRGIAPEVERRIDSELERWRGTPYAKFQRVRGEGADCREFGAGFFDAMFHMEQPTKLPRLPHTSALFDTAAATATIKCMLDAYDGQVVTNEHILEPGDAVVTMSEPTGRRNEGHLIIASATPMMGFHAPERGLDVRPCPIVGDCEIVAVYRARKDDW